MGTKPAEKAKKSEEKAKAAKPKEAAKETKQASAEAGDTVKSSRAENKKTTHHRKHHASTPSREERHCKMKSCKRGYKAKGYCKTHYREWRHGKFGQARYKECADV